MYTHITTHNAKKKTSTQNIPAAASVALRCLYCRLDVWYVPSNATSRTRRRGAGAGPLLLSPAADAVDDEESVSPPSLLPSSPAPATGVPPPLAPFPTPPLTPTPPAINSLSSTLSPHGHSTTVSTTPRWCSRQMASTRACSPVGSPNTRGVTVPGGSRSSVGVCVCRGRLTYIRCERRVSL